MANSASPKLTSIDNYGEDAVDLGANHQGSGLLIVTGELLTHGNIDFEGTILFLGRGKVDRDGGGTGIIKGAVLVANFDPDDPDDDVLGPPHFSVNGAGSGKTSFDSLWVRKQKREDNSRGFSLFELLIVVSMIGILAGFALIKIVRSNQQMQRANSAQQFASYLEKAQMDSVRRHPATTAQMAQVALINASFYSVTLDSTGDGILDAPMVISLPTNSDFQFNGPFPRTIFFDWRGRTVDAAGAPANPSFVTISSAGYGQSRIDLTPAGRPSLEGPPVSNPVVNSVAPAPSYRSTTQVTP